MCLDHAAAGGPDRPRRRCRWAGAGMGCAGAGRRVTRSPRARGALSRSGWTDGATARPPSARPRCGRSGRCTQAAQRCRAAAPAQRPGAGLGGGARTHGAAAACRRRALRAGAAQALRQRAAPSVRRHARWPPRPTRTPACRSVWARRSPSPRWWRACWRCCTTASARGPRATLGRVLEIGTGCGYQTALLAPLAQPRAVDRTAQAAARQGAREPGDSGAGARAAGLRRRPARPPAQCALRQHHRRGGRQRSARGLARAAGRRRPAGGADARRAAGGQVLLVVDRQGDGYGASTASKRCTSSP